MCASEYPQKSKFGIQILNGSRIFFLDFLGGHRRYIEYKKIGYDMI